MTECLRGWGFGPRLAAAQAGPGAACPGTQAAPVPPAARMHPAEASAQGGPLHERRAVWLKLSRLKVLGTGAPLSVAAAASQDAAADAEFDAKGDAAGPSPLSPRRREVRALPGPQRPVPARRPSLARLDGPALTVRGSPRLLSTPARKDPSQVADLLRNCLRLSTGPPPEATQAREFVARWEGPPIRGAGPCFEPGRQLLAQAALQLPGRAQAHVGEALAAGLGGHAMPAQHRRGLAAALMAHVGLRVRASAQEPGEASGREIEAARFATGVLRASCRHPDEVRSMVLDMLNWAVAQQRSPGAACSSASSAEPALKVQEAAAQWRQPAPPRQSAELLLGRVGAVALALGGRQIGPHALRDLLQAVGGLHKGAGQRGRDALAPEDVAMALGTVCTEAGGPVMGELARKVLVAHLCAPDLAADAEQRAATVYHAALALGICDGDGGDFVRRLLHAATASPCLRLAEVGAVAWALGLHLGGADPQRLGWHQPGAPLLAPGRAPVEQVVARLMLGAQDLPGLQWERLVSALALVRDHVTPHLPASAHLTSTSLSTVSVSESLGVTPSSSLSSTSAPLTPSPGSRAPVAAFRLSPGAAAEADAKGQHDGFFGDPDPCSLMFDDEDPASLPRPEAEPPWHPSAAPPERPDLKLG